jgi:hypothetical protein
MTSPVAAVVAPLALYAAAVAWLTWPLAARLATHLPGTGVMGFDALYSIWALAWETHALSTAPWRVADANIFHPTPSALFYGPTGFGALPLFAPVYAATDNPALAINVTFLGGIALTAWGLHCVVGRWTGSHLGGFLAASTFLTASYWLIAVPNTPHWAALHWFPWIVLLAAAARPSLWLVPLVVLQCLTDPVYYAPAVLVPLVLLAAWQLARPGSRAAGRRLAVVVAVAALLLMPVYAGYATVLAANPGLAEQTWWKLLPASAKFPGIPTVPFGRFSLGSVPLFPTNETPAAIPVAAWGMIAAGALALTVQSADSRPATLRTAWAHGVLWTAVGFAISTPAVHVAGGEPWRSPLFLLAAWLDPGLVQKLRVPVRLGVATLIGESILVGVAFTECTRRFASRGRRARIGCAALALLLALSFVTVLYARTSAFPVSEAMRPSPAIPELRQGDGPLLELPAGLAQNSRAMYRSIFHWRPLLNGYSSFWPAGFPERMALASRLPDPGALAILRETTGLAAIDVHIRELFGADRAAWVAAAVPGRRPDLRLLWRDGDELVFAVVAPE